MLKEYINDFWFKIFNDSVFINRLLEGTEDNYDQVGMDLDTMHNALSRHTIDVYRPRKWLFVTYDETDMNKDAMLFDQDNIFFNGLYNFGDRLHNFFTLSIHESIKKIPFIVSSPVNPSLILQENIDYFVDYDQHLLFFRDNPFKAGFDKRFLNSFEAPNMGIGMWFYQINKDYNDVNNIYAETVKLNVPSSEYYKKIVNAIWDLRVEGGTIDNVNKLLLATVDTDFIKEGGKLTKTFEEGSRVWVEIGGALYSAPQGTGILPTQGDDVRKGEMIWDSVKIATGLDTISYDDFPALHLSDKFIGSRFKEGVMVENKEYPFPAQETMVAGDGVLVNDLSEQAYTYLVEKRTGFIFDILVDDDDNNYSLVTSRWDLPFFGRDDTVADFKNYLFNISTREGRDLTQVIIEDNNDKVPDTINLFKEYQQRAFKNNAFFVSVDVTKIPAGVDPGIILSYIKFTIPAYTTLLTFLSAGSTVLYSTSNISENVEAFKVFDVSDDYSGSNISDTLNRNLSI